MHKKIFNIESLRIIGCLSIIFHHIFKYIYNDVFLYADQYNMFHNGYLAVEMFFILSGFFLYLTFDKNLSTMDFIKKKLARLYPVIIFAMSLILIISFTKYTTFMWYDNILTLGLLSGTPLALGLGNLTTCWYVSSMFWTMLFYGSLIRNLNPKITNIIIATITILSYSLILHHNNGTLFGVNTTIYGLLNIGILRALGGMGTGIFIAMWYKDYKHTNCANKKNKAIYTILEAGCLYFIINSLMINTLKYENQIIFVIIIILIILLLLMEKGYISQALNNKNIHCISKLKYSNNAPINDFSCYFYV